MPWPLLEAAGAGSSSAHLCQMAPQELGREADGFQRASASGSVDWRVLDLCCLIFSTSAAFFAS